MVLRQAVRYARCSARATRLAAPTLVPHLRVLPKQSQLQSNLPCLRRQYATPPPQLNHSDISIEKYHEYSDTAMENLLESLEELLDTNNNAEYEVEYSSGVLTLKLGDKGTYVINKQPPNKQIWLSSPLSGPKRYDYSEATDEWIYSRDGQSLGDLLDAELSKAFERRVRLDLTSEVHTPKLA
ncbi:Frataxin homolog, mitochondrial [Sparassis crispa]|uniref:ferroxidase n=1 Tax=Sparassis crispa TaxID=139825 RepID=A0A401G7L3_9APHY|nr:Frataxin homolog, mitochondrial [Sparassis crispa]GBE78147.1 Frataxin homolog, mitochondrial [Sparassis crispa]